MKTIIYTLDCFFLSMTFTMLTIGDYISYENLKSIALICSISYIIIRTIYVLIKIFKLK